MQFLITTTSIHGSFFNMVLEYNMAGSNTDRVNVENHFSKVTRLSRCTT